MHRRWLAALLFCSFLLVPAPAAAQPDPIQLLQDSSQVMEAVQTMRFAGWMDMHMQAARQAQSFSLTMSGEYQQPDRVYLAMGSDTMGLDVEVILIGARTWMRDSGGAWIEGGSATSTVPFNNPSSMGTNSQMYAQFTRNARLVDQGATYRVTGDLDLEAAATLGPPELFSSLAMFQLLGITASAIPVSFVIDKQSLYMAEFTMEMTMEIPDAQARGSIAMNMTFTFSDFNDPSISIQPPA